MRRRSPAGVAFVVVASPGVLRHGIVARFERETGEAKAPHLVPPDAEIASWKPSGFDPTPSLERLDVPALWLFGGGDRNVPAVPSMALLRSLKQKYGKDWTIVVFPGAGHGLFDDPPTDPRALPTAEEWIARHVVVRTRRIEPTTS